MCNGLKMAKISFVVVSSNRKRHDFPLMPSRFTTPSNFAVACTVSNTYACKCLHSNSIKKGSSLYLLLHVSKQSRLRRKAGRKPGKEKTTQRLFE